MHHYSILHVEDDDNDALFVKIAATSVGLNEKILRARDGKEAMDYLSGTGEFADRQKYPFPSLVLLDMKMPRVNGMEVLRWIRSEPSLRSLIVIILSSSPVAGDVDTAYELGANSFLVKPSGIHNLEHIFRLIREFWLDVNELPTISQNPHDTNEIKKHRFPNLER